MFINCIKICGEAVSAGIEATCAFTAEFKKITEDNDSSPDIKKGMGRSKCIVYKGCVA